MTTIVQPEPLIWDSKDPDDANVYHVNFEFECARKWYDKDDFAMGERIRVYGQDNSQAYEFEFSGGRKGRREPRWPSSIGAQVIDGSGIWTCYPLSSASLMRSLQGVPTWTALDGITIQGSTALGNVTSAVLIGGQHGIKYTVLVKALFDDGTSKTATCYLPVWRPQLIAHC